MPGDGRRGGRVGTLVAEDGRRGGLNCDPRPAEEAVTLYKIYRDGVLLTTVSTMPATLGGFTSGESVTLTVSAVNAAGEGPQSGPVTETAG